MLGTVERDRLELIAESNERIVEIAVHEGDRVAEGAVLLRQEAGTLQSRLDAAQANQAEAQRRLADLDRGAAHTRDRRSARRHSRAPRASCAPSRAEYERAHALVERKLVSQSNEDQARKRAILRARNATLHGLAWNCCSQGTRSEQIAGARAAVDRATAGLAEIETVAARYCRARPACRDVEALPYKLGERPRRAGRSRSMLADGAPYARVYVPEPLRSRFTAGSKVEATVDGEAQAFNGTVRYVSAEASFTPYYALTQKDRSRLSLPRRSHARRRARGQAAGGRAGAGAHAGPGLKRDA